MKSWLFALASIAAAQPPTLSPGQVLNAADYSAGGVAPGQVIVITPSNAGPSDLVPWGLAANLSVTDSLGDTRVFFDGIATPIIYTVRGRIGTVVPRQVAGRQSTTVVVEYKGERSAPIELSVIPSAPAIYTLDATGKGQAAMLNETGCCNTIRNPALVGSTVSLYATGEGQFKREDFRVTVGGVPAEIVFTQNEGSQQVDFSIPLGAPIGDAVPLVFSAGGKSSAPGVTMAIRSARRRILVVDPDPATRAKFENALTAAGHNVYFASDLAAARNRVHLHPDLFILSLTLQGDAASKLIAEIRAVQPRMRLLVTMPDLAADTLKRAGLLGAQSVIAKPFLLTSLLDRVEKLLFLKPAVY